MKKLWKLFAGWVTALKANTFTWAKIKLTALYFIVILVIILVYLILLYNEFTRTIISFAHDNILEIDRRNRFIERAFIVTKATLFQIQTEDVLTIFLTLGISYLLAGFVLKPIKEAMLRQKKFLIDASHQLRTPLTIIKTEMEVFLRDKRNYTLNKELLLRKRKGMLSNLEEIDRMSRIIDELLLVARIDAHQEKLHFAIINPGLLVKKSIASIRNYARIKNINLSFSISTTLRIQADEDKLQQAIINVIKNAIDYSKKGSKIKIAVTGKTDTVSIIVADNGIGIPKKDLPHIFERFYKAKNTGIKTKGMGIGLSITEWIINQHKGKINIQSILGKGTTVVILLSAIQSS